jgi:2-oxoisovalerate dehydrogenase E2 component (dihydrolipoyl transacylase)
MSRFVFKMPDLGEGTVEAEVVAWRVNVGDRVAEDDVLCEIMTEKAAVEVPSPVTGRVVARTGEPGDMVPVGAELIVIETEESASMAPAAATSTAAASPGAAPAAPPAAKSATNGAGPSYTPTPAAGAPAPRGRVLASPALRRQAREAGIDLGAVEGSGPGGRVTRRDLEAHQAGSAAGTAGGALRSGGGSVRREGAEEIKVIGVRRLIAQRMAEAKRTIPHFAYVEEVDVTELEALRQHLNERAAAGARPLTLLPLVTLALVRVLERFPQCNATYDAERNVLLRHRPVHVGVATQTSDGLKVPVVRHAEVRALEDLAAEIRRVAESARDGSARREELSGSTITVTSLGKLGGIASTPVINAPEVAIVGLNRMVERPVVRDGAIAIRRMMNLSSSFDHRFVDGHDAASMIQALKERLEHPATIFMPG